MEIQNHVTLWLASSPKTMFHMRETLLGSFGSERVGKM